MGMTHSSAVDMNVIGALRIEWVRNLSSSGVKRCAEWEVVLEKSPKHRGK